MEDKKEYFLIKIELAQGSDKIKEFANHHRYQNFKLQKIWTKNEDGRYIGFKVSLNKMEFGKDRVKMVPIVFWSGENSISFTCEKTKEVLSFLLNTSNKPFDPLVYREECVGGKKLQKEKKKEGIFTVKTTVDEMIEESWKWGEEDEEFSIDLPCIEDSKYVLRVVCSTVLSDDEKQVPLFCFDGGRKYGWKFGALIMKGETKRHKIKLRNSK
jgi:hypothetical protein